MSLFQSITSFHDSRYFMINIFHRIIGDGVSVSVINRFSKMMAHTPITTATMLYSLAQKIVRTPFFAGDSIIQIFQ